MTGAGHAFVNSGRGLRRLQNLPAIWIYIILVEISYNWTLKRKFSNETLEIVGKL